MLGRLAVLVGGALAAGVSVVAGLVAMRGRRRRQREERRATRKAARSTSPAGPRAAAARRPFDTGDGTVVEVHVDEPSSRSETAPTRSAPLNENLQSIRGIGAVNAERLREAGVTSVTQIAAWDEDDVREMAVRIRVSPERIVREAWVAQARELAGATTVD